jgi:hypothetical protein
MHRSNPRPIDRARGTRKEHHVDRWIAPAVEDTHELTSGKTKAAHSAQFLGKELSGKNADAKRARLRADPISLFGRRHSTPVCTATRRS